MVRRTISIRWVVVTLLAVVVGGASAYLLHGWQLSRTITNLLAQASHQEAAADWKRACEILDLYLLSQPQDAGAWARLAANCSRLAENAGEKLSPEELAGQRRRAIQVSYRALAFGDKSQERELRTRLAKLLLEAGRFLEAETESRKLLASDPSDPVASRVLALSLFNQLVYGGLASEATADLQLVAKLEHAYEQNPGDAELAGALAATFREHAEIVDDELPDLTTQDRNERADEAMNRLVQHNPQDTGALLARFRYRKRYELAQADEDLRQALEWGAENEEVLLTAGLAALAQAQRMQSTEATKELVQEELKKSKDYLERLVDREDSKNAPQILLSLGDAWLGLEQPEKALSVWQQGVKREGYYFALPTTRLTFHWRIADACLALGRFDETQKTLKLAVETLERLQVGVSNAKRLEFRTLQTLREATLLIRRGEFVTAVRDLRAVIIKQGAAVDDVQTGVRARLLLGEALAALGEWPDAAMVYDQIAALQPRVPGPRLASANAWLAAGRPGLASDRAEQANALQESYAGWLVFASAQVQLQAELPAAERNWTRVERALGALQGTPIDKRGASPWRVDFLLADMAAIQAKDSSQSELSQGKPGEILRKSEGAFHSHASYWGELALAYQHLALPADADRAYGELVKREEQALNTKIVAARLASDRKDYSRAKTILSSAFGSASPSEEARLHGELQRIAQAEGDTASLIKLLEEQHRRRPNDANVLRKQAELALERQDFSALQALEQELSKKEINVVGLPWALYFRAYRLLAQSTGDREQKLREAEAAAAELERIWPDRPQAFTLKGLIYRQSGRADLAAAAFEQAIRLGDNRVAVYEQLLPLLDQLNRPVDVDRYLSRLNQQTPLSQVLTEVASFHQFRRAQKDQAVTIARSAAKLRPDDAGAYLWLGRVLLVTEQFDEAFAAFQKAVELGPTEVRTWNGLFSYHLRRGDKAQARETLQKLVQSIQADPTERAFIEGQGLELLGDVAQAARAYEQAQATAPTNLGVLLRLANLFLKTDPFKAEGYLDAALRIEKAKKDPQMAVARRMLAVIKMTRGTATDIEKANALLASPGDDVPVTVDDRRLHALLLARQGSLKSVDRALEMLEEIVSSEPSSVKGDRLVLSQLLEQRARVAETIEGRDALLKSAEEKLAALAVAEDALPGHLAAFIAFLNRQKRSEDAATWLDKLDALLKGRGAQPDEIAQLIELRLAHGSGKQCEIWLQALEKSDPHPLRAAAFRARLLTGADAHPQLEGLIEPLAEEKVRTAADAVQKAQIYQQAGGIYFAAKHYVKAENWYRRLYEADAQHFPLLVMAIARQGRLDDAVTLCQETAQKKDHGPRPAIALAAALTESSGDLTRGAQADQLFADALKRFGSDIRLLYAIGVLRTTQHRPLEAEVAFKDILNLNPNHVASLNNLALVLGENPKYRKQALNYIERAIEINGLETGLLDTKGAILLYENKPQDAIPLLRAAANGMISDPRHNFHLAVAYRDLGQLDEARDELKQALADDLEAKVLTQRDREFLTDLKRLLAQ